jgi:hypothetical protein
MEYIQSYLLLCHSVLFAKAKKLKILAKRDKRKKIVRLWKKVCKCFNFPINCNQLYHCILYTIYMYLRCTIISWIWTYSAWVSDSLMYTLVLICINKLLDYNVIILHNSVFCWKTNKIVFLDYLFRNHFFCLLGF